MSTPGSTPNLSDAMITISPWEASFRMDEIEPENPDMQEETTPEETSPDLSSPIDDLFVKAADTIGHAMNLDGLLFFDAVTSGIRHESIHSSSTVQGADTSARLLAEYWGEKASERQLPHSPTQSLIQLLTDAYPNGHVFVVDEQGILEHDDHNVDGNQQFSDTCAVHSDWKDLLKCIPQARYAIFLPVWHYQRESCFATCLLWVSDIGKTLDASDVNSLIAFSHSAMAEVYRLEASRNTQSKTDFVSTISHELRSPLHGILATVELIQENNKDLHLLSLTKMIESCSSTLLDTFDHLLQFSKINSRASDGHFTHRSGFEDPANQMGTGRAAVDLVSLVEDVLDTVFLGQSSAMEFSPSLSSGGKERVASRSEVPPLGAVLATTYFEKHQNWTIPLDIGAWKRILLNLFSNALRYTESGHVDVSLRVLEKGGTDGKHISLSVTDTGVGMSYEFLKYHLFKPFMQENSLLPGTGLGLIIVKSIVESLEGNIVVESRQNEGTRVTVNIPVFEEPEATDATDDLPELFPPDKFRGLSVSLISMVSQGIQDLAPSTRIVSAPAVLQRSVRNICESDFGMTLTDHTSINDLANSDLILLDAPSFHLTENSDLEKLLPEGFSKLISRMVVILRSPTQALGHLSIVKKPAYMSSPITRKTLSTAFLKALEEEPIKIAKSLDSPNSPVEDVRSRLENLSTTDAPTGSQRAASRVRHSNHSSTASPEETTSHISPESNKTSASIQKTPLHSHLANKLPSRATPECRFQRLLLVDDNPINLKVLAAFAGRLHCRFSTACDGAEAVALYRNAILEEADPFDCIFMDISMPVMDGFQAVTAIRQFEEQHGDHAASTPTGDDKPPRSASRSFILALTGLGSETARNTAKQSGFDVFLTKPTRFKDVLPLISRTPDSTD